MFLADTLKNKTTQIESNDFVGRLNLLLSNSKLCHGYRISYTFTSIQNCNYCTCTYP